MLPYTFFNYCIALPVITPFLAASISFLVSKKSYIQKTISLSALLISTASSIILFALTVTYGPFAVTIGSWVEKNTKTPLGITLVVDQLSSALLVISNCVMVAVLVYAFTQRASKTSHEDAGLIFQPAYLILSAGVSNAFLAGDLFNLYVSFEVFLMSSFVLITIGGGSSRIRAGVSYVVVSMVSSVIFLIGIIFTYAATGTLNLAALSKTLQALPEGVRGAIFAIFLVAFGIKAAVFPLYSWLPDSYPTAPVPVTAVFAGLLTKIGIYSIIRIHFLLFPEKFMNNILLITGLLTMIFGILGAIAQDDIKRLVSFTLVSHIGFLLFGLSLVTVDGLSAAIFYMIHHIVIQTSLFLIVGMIERNMGTTSIQRLGGIKKSVPILGTLLLIPSLNLAGLPPFSGFIGKILLLQAGIEEGSTISWILTIGTVVTSVLTLYVIMRTWVLIIWKPLSERQSRTMDKIRSLVTEDTGEMDLIEIDKKNIPLGMLIPTLTLIIISFVLGFGANFWSNYTHDTAKELIDNHNYSDAVYR